MCEYTYEHFLAEIAERRCNEYISLTALAIFPEAIESIITNYLTIFVGNDYRSDVTKLMRMCKGSTNLGEPAMGDVALRVQYRTLLLDDLTCKCGHIGPHLGMSIQFEVPLQPEFDCEFSFTWTPGMVLEYLETDDMSQLAEPIRDWFNIHVNLDDDEWIDILIRDLIIKVVNSQPRSASMSLLMNDLYKINWARLSQNHATIDILGEIRH